MNNQKKQSDQSANSGVQDDAMNQMDTQKKKSNQDASANTQDDSMNKDED